MKKLKIWLLQTGEPLPIQNAARKMRTALLAEKLAARGHDLLWWGSAFEHQRKIWISDKDRDFQVTANYAIYVLRGLGYKNNISLIRYFDHLVVARKFRNQSRKFDRPDIIVASMPCYHLAYEGMRYAQRNRILLLVDIRDLWPDIFVNPLGKMGLQKIGRFALARDFFKLSLLLKNADALVAVSKGYLNWGLNKISRTPRELDRVFYHGYKDCPDIQRNNAIDSTEDLAEKKIFLFVGTFGKSYELALIIDVAKRLSVEEIKDIIFYIAGTGEQHDSLKKEAVDLPNVILPGWIDAQGVQNLLHKAWVGIVPCKSVKDTIPNKVFEYLSAGLPIISSLEGEIKHLIDLYRMGLNYRTGDVEGLYRCIKMLAGDTDMRYQMSQAALTFFRQYGDADKIYDDYANHIEKLVENFKKFD